MRYVTFDRAGISFQYVNYGTNSANFLWHMLDIVKTLPLGEKLRITYLSLKCILGVNLV